jgi:hypothetical protein
MQPVERRRALLRVVASIVLAWIVIFGAFFILPIGHESTGRAIGRLVIDVALIGIVVWWEALRIVKADLPELRAMEALGFILALFLALFAALYLAMSHNSASTFTEPLDHMRALYFTITVFSTVGFGDITAKTDTARAIVSAQMVLDLVIIGVVVRLLVTAVRTGLGRSQDTVATGAS